MQYVDEEYCRQLHKHQAALERRVLSFRDVVHLEADREVGHHQALQEDKIEERVWLATSSRIVNDWLLTHHGEEGQGYKRDEIP